MGAHFTVTRARSAILARIAAGASVADAAAASGVTREGVWRAFRLDPEWRKARIQGLHAQVRIKTGKRKAWAALELMRRSKAWGID